MIPFSQHSQPEIRGFEQNHRGRWQESRQMTSSFYAAVVTCGYDVISKSKQIQGSFAGGTTRQCILSKFLHKLAQKVLISLQKCAHKKHEVMGFLELWRLLAVSFQFLQNFGSKRTKNNWIQNVPWKRLGPPNPESGSNKKEQRTFHRDPNGDLCQITAKVVGVGVKFQFNLRAQLSDSLGSGPLALVWIEIQITCRNICTDLYMDRSRSK